MTNMEWVVKWGAYEKFHAQTVSEAQAKVKALIIDNGCFTMSSAFAYNSKGECWTYAGNSRDPVWICISKGNG